MRLVPLGSMRLGATTRVSRHVSTLRVAGTTRRAEARRRRGDADAVRERGTTVDLDAPTRITVQCKDFTLL